MTDSPEYLAALTHAAERLVAMAGRGEVAENSSVRVELGDDLSVVLHREHLELAHRSAEYLELLAETVARSVAELESAEPLGDQP